MKIDKYVFSRHEIKYKLTPLQYANVLQSITQYLSVDEYGETTIQSLYYDTDNWQLIRASIEKPFYKEKVRARSYGLANGESKVFLELKKKCDKVVFKRRISIKEKNLNSFTSGQTPAVEQIEKEIRYVFDMYNGLKPSMLLLYDRTAYYDYKSNTDLRITFDKNIRYRKQRLNLHSDLEGAPILPNGEIMMEIKTGSAYPAWLVNLLNTQKIFKTSFSKYGTAYQLELQAQRSQNKYILTEEAV